MKRVGGKSFQDILDQILKAIVLTAHKKENFEIFILAQRGMEIGFFEYIQYQPMLDQQNIENYRGFVPITLRSDPLICQHPWHADWRGMLDNMLQDMPAEKRNKMETLAHPVQPKMVETPCIFNLEHHEKEIDFIFRLMAATLPRKLPD